MSVSDGSRGPTLVSLQCTAVLVRGFTPVQCSAAGTWLHNAVSWQEEGEKAKKKEPLPRLCHSDRDEDDANYAFVIVIGMRMMRIMNWDNLQTF